jgi:hypothetical protein
VPQGVGACFVSPNGALCTQLGDVRDYIAKAFPTAHSIVLDSEILLVDDRGALLKFGSLGAPAALRGCGACA